jgi:glycosyltransferase involved in cell wall biosynthesis
MKQHPLVSLCVPTYNSGKYLAESLDSLLAQDYANREIIVSDNASSDETVAILRDYAARGAIRLNVQSTNVGAGANFNRLIELAQGELVAIYHSDDLYAPEIVSAAVAEFVAKPDVGLVGTMARVINDAGEQIASYHLPRCLQRLGRADFSFDEAMLGTCGLRGCQGFLVTPSVMVRRSLYEELGLFDQPRFKAACDYEMWLRIATRSRVAVIDRPLMSYRIHQSQGSQHEVRTNIELPDLLLVLDHYLPQVTDPGVRRAVRNFYDWTLVKTALKQNYARLFGKSSTTLAGLRGHSYRPLAFAVRCANRLRLRLGVRPRGQAV